MKSDLHMSFRLIVLILPFLFTHCTSKPKSLSVIETGMSKDQVTAIVGEPKNKNVINATEVWDYPDSGRTVVFRKDTVYRIFTSPEARADSIGRWLDKTNSKVKDELGNFTDKVEKAGEKVKDKLTKDSVSR